MDLCLGWLALPAWCMETALGTVGACQVTLSVSSSSERATVQ